jgi:transposase
MPPCGEELGVSLSIGIKTIKGHGYYYARECQRVNGKPRIVWQKYLGKAERIVKAVEQAASPTPPEEVVVSEFGAVAALYQVAQRLQLVETVNRHASKRDQGLSVGHYMLVAALNRAVCPKSKAAIGEWFETTPLRRLIPATKRELSSKRFWDNMGHLDAEKIERIEQELAERLVTEFGLDTRCLLYDTTNFFSFIDSFNDRCSLAQRGKSKEGRSNLRLIGVALMVSADFHVPLFHHTYAGNRNDAKEFQSVTERLVRRYHAITNTTDSITVVFDKGNNSADNLRQVDAGPFHFVGSLKLNHCPDLAALPLDEYHAVDHPKLCGVKAYRTTREVLGAQRTVLATYNDQLFLAQTQSLLKDVQRRTRRLAELARKLDQRRCTPRARGAPPTVASVRKQVDEVLTVKGQPLKEVIRINISEDEGLPRLQFEVDHDALHRLGRERFGRTILFTDNDAWTDAEITLAYRGQAAVEDAFRTMKDPQFVSWAPMFHWTDDKIRVHAFYCVLALMLASLLHREVHKAGIQLSIPRLLEELTAIREVAIVYPPIGSRRPPTITLAKLTDLQRQLSETLKLERHLAAR